MIKVWNRSIVIRSTLAVLGVTLLVGSFADFIALKITTQRTIKTQHEALETLLDVVEPSAQAACFVEDKGLAEQVVQGLISTPSIKGAQLFSGSTPLGKAARSSNAAQDPTASEQISRKIISPFQAGEQIGELILMPDMAETQRQITNTTQLVRVVVICLTLALGLAMALTIHTSITKPIRTLSERLHELEATTGARLFFPGGHEHNEIGQLVRDVNALVERLVEALWSERELIEQLELDKKKVQSILEHAGTGIFVVRSNGSLDAWTPAFLRLLDLENSPPPKGISFPVLFGLNAALAEEWLNSCLKTGERRVETLQIRDLHGDRQRWLQLTLDPLGDDWIQGLLDDVTIHQQAAQAAHELAVRDALTGALNRLGTERVLADKLPRAHQGITLMMVDLDKFKEVNDTYGHDAGDEVLRQCTLRMTQILRRTDLVARLGGDEFLLIMDALSDENVALNIAQKLIKGINEPIAIPGCINVQVGASIGVTLYQSGEDLPWEAVLKRADRAMYLSKQSGRNCARLINE